MDDWSCAPDRPALQPGGDLKRPGPGGELTVLLRAWAQGDSGAGERLFRRVYPSLRRLASSRLSTEAPSLTLQTTDLVHETFLRLTDQTRLEWKGRAHFFAIAARIVRRVIVDRAKYRMRQKRGGGALHLPLDAAEPSREVRSIELLALDRELDKLARINAEAARVVELRFFSGLSLDSVAEAMGLGRATVVRRWKFARAWLQLALSGDD